MTARLIGIARHAFPKGPMEVLERAHVGLATGVEGDFRGGLKPGKRNKRQVTLMQADDWQAALDELGVVVPWEQRRVNLLVEGVVLPGALGVTVRIGDDVLLELNGECDPCTRMDAVAPGLNAALKPGLRAGRLSTVVAEGRIRIGDPVRVEEEVTQWQVSERSTI